MTQYNDSNNNTNRAFCFFYIISFIFVQKPNGIASILSSILKVRKLGCGKFSHMTLDHVPRKACSTTQK